MKKKPPYIYLSLLAALLLLMSIPHVGSENLRGTAIAMFSPVWNFLLNTKLFFKDPFGDGVKHFNSETIELTNDEKLNQLKLEKQFLENELIQLKEIILNVEDSISKLDYKAVPARVIFRAPSSWNSSLWIGVGEADNPPNETIIAKNSPVLVGVSLVGVIDYVGKHQSRVRLITDSGLTPSVRAARGGMLNRVLYEKINSLIMQLDTRNELFIDNNEKNSLLAQLEDIKNNLNETQDSWYLAKGELSGSSKPMWRAKAHYLKGTGFNYDFPDEQGPARDLRTGQPVADNKAKTMPILKVGDLLITTGLDGIFPFGLHVAEVTKINLLKEGDYYYDLEALPTAGNLEELNLVFVIPPQEYNPEDRPPLR